MGVFSKVLAWIRPAGSPEEEAEAARRRQERETIKTSQLSPSGGSNLPPTPDVTEPRD